MTATATAGQALVLNLSATQFEFCEDPNRIVWLEGPAGEGKCLGKGTPVVMADGTMRPVESLQVGEQVMGWDSQPKTIVALGRGQEQMYRVVPVRGESFICNRSHILTLKRTNTSKPTKRDLKAGEIVDLPIHQYINASRTFKTSYKLFHRGADWAKQSVPLDPYWLGLWLGDGTSCRTEIWSADREVSDYLNQLAAQSSVSVRIVEQAGNQSKGYAFYHPLGKQYNPFSLKLDALHLRRNKHIPLCYKANNRETRLQVLAGLIDSDGWLNRVGYQVMLKSKVLADDLAFLARSLGFFVQVKPSRKGIKKLGFVGDYYRVSIDGPCHEIPVKVKRKHAPIRRQKKDVLVSGIKQVEPLGLGEYYGFTLAEDPHYLLGDFTVTHNTFAAIAAMLRHRERMVAYFRAKNPGKPVRPMQVAIIRDTHVNIKTNTVRSIQRAYPGMFSFRDDAKKMFQAGVEAHHLNAWYEKPEHSPPTWIDANLFGMDDLASLDRIQGAEYDLIWIEEPAPIMSSGNNGIREEVYLVCGSRIRGGGEPKRLQITMNPAEEGHWTSKHQDNPIIDSLSVYRIKPKENKHLSDLDREMTKAMYAGRADLTARFVEGKRARVYDGVAVTPEFQPEIHVAKDWLMPDPAIEVIRCWDGGLHPACVTMQQMPNGRLYIYDSMVGQNMGMAQLIESKVKLVLARPRYQRIKRWRDCGDPTLTTPDNSNSDHMPSRVIQDVLKTTYEPGVSSWEIRREALKYVMTQSPNGLPMLQVNPRTTETETINWIKGGFSGDYSYKVTPTGQVIRDVPVKNLFCVDADTEMLTREGWKRYDHLVMGEPVYTYDLKRDELVVSPILALSLFHEGGEAFRYSGQSLDMIVTPQHRCIVGHRWSKGIRAVSAEDMNASDSLLRTASYQGQKKSWYSDEFVRLCAWVAMEGTYGSGMSGAVTIVQSEKHNAPYCEDLDRLVQSFRGRTFTHRHHHMRTWQVSGEIADAIHAVMPNKYPSMAFINRMTNVQRRMFLYECVRGDGTWTKKHGHLPPPGAMQRNRDFFVREGTPRIFQKSYESISALQTMCALTGIRGVIHRKKAGCDGWSLSITRQSRFTTVSNLTKETVTIPFAWCPQTTEGTWVARRNGHIFITGNSHPCDAVSHVVAHIYFRPQQERPPSIPRTNRNRAKGYGVG